MGAASPSRVPSNTDTLLFNGGFGLNVFVVDPDTGKLGAAPHPPITDDVGSDTQAIDVAIHPSGNFVYAVHTFTGHLVAYRIHPDDGSLEPIAGSPYDANPFPYSVAVDPWGRFVYVGNDDADEITAFGIDPTSGALHALDRPPFAAHGLQPEMVFSIR